MTLLNQRSYTPQTIGLDKWLAELDFKSPKVTYPPFNLIGRKDDRHKWTLQLAVAGFKREDIKVEVANSVLTITADSFDAEDENRTYIHRGIAKRAFTRTWALAADVVVQEATLSDGLLTIELEEIIPEEKKPRTIEIR